MFHRMILSLAALALFALVPSGAGGTILVRKDLAELCRESELIVSGTVASQSSAWKGDTRLIFTHTTIVVSETLKGAGKRSIVVSEIGGTVGDITCRVPGMPGFRVGEKVLVILKKDALGQWRTHGAVQGKFTVETNRASGEQIVPARPGLEYVTAGFFGAEEVASSGAIALDDFAAKVKTLAARGARKEEKK